MKYENLTLLRPSSSSRQYGIEVERKGDRRKAGHYDALGKLANTTERPQAHRLCLE
jgi:hypothetical protein